MKVYGPYLRKDGRQHVIIIDNGKRRTVSYPKYIMEKELGRNLHPDLETVHHIDGNFNNNELSNLQIIERTAHVRLDSKGADGQTHKCPVCEKEFFLEERTFRNNQMLQKKAGPFCSRKCAGIYGQKVQWERYMSEK